MKSKESLSVQVQCDTNVTPSSLKYDGFNCLISNHMSIFLTGTFHSVIGVGTPFLFEDTP